jgi:hypothetical protein
MVNGIAYLAIGLSYLQQAVLSAISVIEHTASCPNITIYTDVYWSSNVLIKDCENINIENISHYCDCSLSPDVLSAYLKTKLYELSPFNKTLFLDTDIRAVGDVSYIWSYCNKSIAVARAFSPLYAEANYSEGSEEKYTQKSLSILGDFAQYNTGVFLFEKCDRISEIFELWNREWHMFKKHENMSFTRITTQGVNVDFLDSKYNQFYPDANLDSILIHYIDSYKIHLDTKAEWLHIIK